MNAQSVRDYYDACHKDYRRIWHLDDCLAMHLGFWSGDAQNLRQALLRQNAVMADRAGITDADAVIDLGCGVGGSCIDLARRRGCRATGVTISDRQAAHARRHAAERGVADRTDFVACDFAATPFADRSFDVAWAIESVCHAADKRAWLAEARRLLRPGGRLIVADGFAARPPRSAGEAALLDRSFRGWGVASLERDAAFRGFLDELGFVGVDETDATPWVYRSSRRLYLCSYPAYAVDFMERLQGKRGAVERGNVTAARKQFLSLRKGLWKYKLFYAEKPEEQAPPRVQ